MADYVKLANDQGSFYDPETGFGLSRDDVEELTEPIGRLTAERLRFGGLVRCDPPEEIPPTPPLPKGGTEEEDIAEPDTDVVDETEGDAVQDADPTEVKLSKKRATKKK